MASKGSAAFREILTITAIWGICFRSNRNPVGLNRWSSGTILARPKSSRSSLHFGQAKQIREAERDQRLKCFESSSPTRSSAYNEKTFPLKNRVCEALCFKALRCKAQRHDRRHCYRRSGFCFSPMDAPMATPIRAPSGPNA